MALQLILPTTSLEQRSRCHMCGFECDAVHTSAFMRHVRKCVGEHEGDFQAVIDGHNRSYFTSSPDPERDAHFAAGGN